MMDSGMDVKMDPVGVIGIAPEALVPPPMDLEESPLDEIEPSAEPGEGASIAQQRPTAPADNLALPKLSDLDSGLCNPRAEAIRVGLDGDDESQRSSRPQGSTTFKAADVEDSRNTKDEQAKASDQEQNVCWITKPDQASEVGSNLKIKAAVDRGELLMELEEEDVEEEVPETDQAEFLGLFAQLQRLNPGFRDKLPSSEEDTLAASDSEESHGLDGDKQPLLEHAECRGLPGKCPCPLHGASGQGLRAAAQHLLRSVQGQRTQELLSSEDNQEHMLSLLHYEGGVTAEENDWVSLARSDVMTRAGCQNTGVEGRAVAPEKVPPGPASHDLEERERKVSRPSPRLLKAAASFDSSLEAHSWEGPSDPSWVTAGEPGLTRTGDSSPTSDPANKGNLSSFPTYKDVPGPCEPEDLLDGVIFGAKYLGSTQLVSERNPSTSVRMTQAQEAVDRIKAPEGESQPMTEVDLFVSTQRIKVLTADSQEAMMDHPLQTISYIADIGNIVVLMARRKLPRRADSSTEKQLYKMICHVFHSSDAQLIAQAIGQAFTVAYRHFLRASGIDPSQLGSMQGERDDNEDPVLAEGEELYNGDLAHFSKQENCKEVVICKQKGEILGVVIVESGWGSILPTVVIANLMHGGAAERSGKLSIGDRIMSVNGMSLVGLPLASCQSIIRDLKNQMEVTLSIVHCPPVTTAVVRRPGTKYPLGFCVENGIICSLMRGGIAERGGVRVGHRIIEINGQSVVAMPHEKIIQILTQAVSKVHIKTMPASTYHLLTGQKQPVFL